jgi:hypothetical protein
VRDSKFLMRIHGTSTRRPPLLFCTALALALLALPAAKPACFRRQLLVRQVPQGCACVRAAGGSGARHVRIRSNLLDSDTNYGVLLYTSTIVAL